ncbi:glutathione S-transferase family protein [Novosphingobium aerophilum]|uniref:glutathione S-transferase family protein n=1 Tax=Novosphingobium TaxID=165696 RepID=UPI0012C57DE9|nr:MULTISPECIES: glutathione S-transferase family protein [unclassified Novosphingobium]MPS67695.1 glutathione S-transferase family protein [Novosphingobium sp.]WRT93056.1 glutathione S-transferase family protein [Novosphingobium sp. RL4]
MPQPTITAFAQSPDRGRGLARDMAVRWALEEVGQPYAVRLVSFEEMKQPDHRSRHPFGQIPTYEQGDLALFESGAIVLHIAQSHPGLLPEGGDARMRAVMWIFAALSTVEPVIVQRSEVLLFERERPWYETRLASIEQRIEARLAELAVRLGTSEWLEGEFSAGDLMMVQVLRRLGGSDVLAANETVLAYVARGEARPAFQRAFAAQLAVFEQAKA